MKVTGHLRRFLPEVNAENTVKETNCLHRIGSSPQPLLPACLNLADACPLNALAVSHGLKELLLVL